MAFGSTQPGDMTKPVGIRLERVDNQYHVPPQFTGKTTWVQTSDGLRRSFRVRENAWFHAELKGLDTNYPYSKEKITADVPSQALNNRTNEVEADDHFMMYLMFTPDVLPGRLAIPVALRRVQWFWQGKSKWDGKSWKLTDPLWSDAPQDLNWTEHPVWTKNVKNWQYLPGR